MSHLLARVIINALSIGAAAILVRGITLTGPMWKILPLGVLFGLINFLIKPVMELFALPLIILTLGLFMLVINALMLMLTTKLSGSLNLGLHVHGFLPAFWGAIIISIVNMVLSWLTGVT
jgi:putative membrane protein